MTTTVTADLQGVLKLKVKPQETQAAFAERLARKANDMGDEDWQGLDRNAQYWVNEALEAIEKSQPLPLPSGIEVLFNAVDLGDQPGPVAEKPVKGGKKQKPAPAAPKAKAKAKGAKKAAAPKAKNGRGPKGKFGPTTPIKVVPEANPFRVGSKCSGWFGKIKDGMTVAQAVEAGVPRHHIRWAHTLGHLKIG